LAAKFKGLGHPPQKVLVVQTAFIGDVVFTSPLVHAIKRAHPRAQVWLLVRPKSREVAACIPEVDGVLTFDKYGGETGPGGLLQAAARIRREKFDLLVSPHRSARSALVARLSGVPCRVGYKRGLGRLAYNVALLPLPGEPCNLIQDLKLLEAVGIPAAGTRLRLAAPEDKSGYADGFLEQHAIGGDDRLVALCIGAYWATKRWPAVYFASLGESLKERGYRPLIFGGPYEKEIVARIAEARGEPLVSCVGNSLAESAALLSRCDMAVGGDSGMTHMARALGVPTVLIYGPTDQRANCFDEKTRVLSAKVKCRPCSRHGPRRCPKRHHDCMRMVSPEDVLDALRRITDLQTPVPRPGGRATRARPDTTPLPG